MRISNGGEDLQLNRGETLGSVANEIAKATGNSAKQVLADILRENPDYVKKDPTLTHIAAIEDKHGAETFKLPDYCKSTYSSGYDSKAALASTVSGGKEGPVRIPTNAISSGSPGDIARAALGVKNPSSISTVAEPVFDLGDTSIVIGGTGKPTPASSSKTSVAGDSMASVTTSSTPTGAQSITIGATTRTISGEAAENIQDTADQLRALSPYFKDPDQIAKILHNTTGVKIDITPEMLRDDAPEGTLENATALLEHLYELADEALPATPKGPTRITHDEHFGDLHTLSEDARDAILAVYPNMRDWNPRELDADQNTIVQYVITHSPNDLSAPVTDPILLDLQVAMELDKLTDKELAAICRGETTTHDALAQAYGAEAAHELLAPYTEIQEGAIASFEAPEGGYAEMKNPSPEQPNLGVARYEAALAKLSAEDKAKYFAARESGDTKAMYEILDSTGIALTNDQIYVGERVVNARDGLARYQIKLSRLAPEKRAALDTARNSGDLETVYAIYEAVDKTPDPYGAVVQDMRLTKDQKFLLAEQIKLNNSESDGLTDAGVDLASTDLLAENIATEMRELRDRYYAYNPEKAKAKGYEATPPIINITGDEAVAAYIGGQQDRATRDQALAQVGIDPSDLSIKDLSDGAVASIIEKRQILKDVGIDPDQPGYKDLNLVQAKAVASAMKSSQARNLANAEDEERNKDNS